MREFAPPLRSTAGTLQRRGWYRGVIDSLPWGERSPPEGLISFAERFRLRDANISEEVVVVGNLAECAALPRARNPLPDRRGDSGKQAAKPRSLTRRADREGFNARRRSARNSCQHAKGSGLSAKPGATRRN